MEHLECCLGHSKHSVSIAVPSQDDSQPSHIRKSKIPDVKEHTPGHTTHACRQIPVLLLRSTTPRQAADPSSGEEHIFQERGGNLGEENNCQSPEE